MYIYNTLPIELLDSIIAQTQPHETDFWSKDKDYIVISKNSGGEYIHYYCSRYTAIEILEIPYIVGIKYIGGQNEMAIPTHASLVH